MQGTWTLFFSWGCNGFYGQTVLTLNGDGSFSTADGGAGNWALVSGMVTLLFKVGANPSYAGNVVGSAITGMFLMPNGTTGCWYAINSQLAPTATQKSDLNSAGVSSK